MSNNPYDGVNNAALSQAYENLKNPAQSKHGSQQKTGGGFGFIFAMLFIGVVVYVLFAYVPPQLDDRYAGQGAVIGMVNPDGSDPQRDLQYSQVNLNNSEANLTNSRAEQRRSSVWIIFILVLGFLAMVAMIAKSVAAPKL